MIPNINILMNEIEEVEYPTKTYKIEVRNEADEDRINGYTDDLDAIRQAIYLILNTERYAFPIYSWDYGVELVDLIGKPIPYVMSEVPRRIKDALMQDSRITNVKDFTFEKHKSKLHTTFVVVTNSGDITSELEVTI
jgi:phage baseplate assembly protein W